MKETDKWKGLKKEKRKMDKTETRGKGKRS
jgi:hypothetical protein